MDATPLGRSSFYVYFDGLDDLVARLLGRLEDALWEPARAWIDGPPGPEGLAQALTGVVDVWAEHGPVLTAIVQASWQDERVADLWRDGLMARFVAGVAGGIARQVDTGDIPASLDPDETATALLLMNERYLMDRLGRLPQGDPGVAAATLQVIWSRVLYGGA